MEGQLGIYENLRKPPKENHIVSDFTEEQINGYTQYQWSPRPISICKKIKSSERKKFYGMRRAFCKVVKIACGQNFSVFLTGIIIIVC